jgi:hypothetical protein
MKTGEATKIYLSMLILDRREHWLAYKEQTEIQTK